MSLALLQTTLLLPVEALINRMLALDPATGPRLAALDGRTLAIHATRPQTQLFIVFRSGKLHLSVVDPGNPTASLHGPLVTMLALLQQSEALTSLHSSHLELRGSTAFVQQVQQLLLTLDIDWEFHLASLLGDIPTQALGSGLQQLRGLVSGSTLRLQEDAADFLYEESRLLVSTAELEQQYNAITDLALQLDRLQARIRALCSRPRTN